LELPGGRGTCTVASPIRGELLEMVPLLNGGREANYDLAFRAFDEGTLHVSEVSESGAVPTLRVANDGPRPVLLLDGEELVGAKQNRVLNVTILVAAKQRIDVPVSCVESGRWHYRARKFKDAEWDAEWLMNSEGRARKMRHVSDSLRRMASRAGDQADVWMHIEEKLARLGAKSPTSAQGAMYDQHGPVLEREVEALGPVECQVGAVFAAHGRVLGLELFDAPATLGAMLPKIVRSYALDAYDYGRRRPGRQGCDVEQFLAGVVELQLHDYPAVGLGTDVRMEGRGMAGGALLLEDRYVHLSVFADGGP
jgi:hypothetical protein